MGVTTCLAVAAGQCPAGRLQRDEESRRERMESVKYILFALALFVGVPLLTALAYKKRFLMRWLLFIAVFLTHENYRLSINFFPDEFYRGTARGIEVTIADMCFWALFLALLLTYRLRVRLIPVGGWLFLAYLFWCSLSIMNAANPLYSVYELWKMLMMWVSFVVVANYLYHTRDIEPILKGIGAVVIWAFIVVIYQKYFVGRFQTPGIFAHQNTAGMYMGMAGPLFLTRWLEERNTRWDSLFYAVAFVCGGAIAFFTFSRGAMLFFPLGCALSLLLSIGHRVSQRKLLIVFFIGTVATLGLVKMAPRIIDRFERAPESSKLTRLRLAKAAINMANDEKVIGVGINNWGVKINPPFTYAEYREELKYDEEFKDGLVETIYLMTAAECGWVGLSFLLLCFGGFYLINTINWFRTYRTNINYVSAGIAGGLLSVFGQSLLEWVLKQTPVFYELMMMFALISAVSMTMSVLGGEIPLSTPWPSKRPGHRRVRKPGRVAVKKRGVADEPLAPGRQDDVADASAAAKMISRQGPSE